MFIIICVCFYSFEIQYVPFVHIILLQIKSVFLLWGSRLVRESDFGTRQNDVFLIYYGMFVGLPSHAAVV